MRLLLDTQLYLWFLADSRKLSSMARDEIASADEVRELAALALRSARECLKLTTGHDGDASNIFVD